MDWSEFKKLFENSGIEIHTQPFEVEWSEDGDGNLIGQMWGLNQELVDDTRFVVTLLEFHNPVSFRINWESTSIDPFLGEKYKGHVVVSTAFLAACAIHYGDVSALLGCES